MDEKKTDDAEETFEYNDENNLDETELEVVEEKNQSKIKLLQDKLKNVQQEKAEHLENLQRAKAEFLNARKRLEDEKRSHAERLINDHIERLLPLCDSFYMAMSNKEAWETVDSAWRKGVESIASQLRSILTSYGVKETGKIGESFDPNIHEAVGNIPVDKPENADTIVSVLQPGYEREVKGITTIVRPARVIVGTFTK